MKLSSIDLGELADVAISAAVAAGRMVARSRPADVQLKAGAHSHAAQVVTEVDRRSEEMIVDILSTTFERFDIGLLAEERHDDRGRLHTDHFWCVDPLDGTLPFVEGVPGYAVSIALVRRDGTPLIGVVHEPIEATTWHAIHGDGLFRNGRRWTSGQPSETETPPDASAPAETSDVLSVFTDRSFASLDDHETIVDALHRIARSLNLASVEFPASAGAVMNACGVLTSAPACYFKFPKATGGGSSWDFAATACLFAEAGAVVSDIHGDPLELNRADATGMNHRGVLFASNEALARRIRALHRGGGNGRHAESTLR